MGNCPYTNIDPDDLYPEWRLRPMVMGFLSVASYFHIFLTVLVTV